MLVQVGDGDDGGGVCGGVGGGYCSRSVAVLAGGYCSRSVTVLAQLPVRVATPLSFRSGFVQLARLAVIRVRPRTLVDGELVDGSPHARRWRAGCSWRLVLLQQRALAAPKPRRALGQR